MEREPGNEVVLRYVYSRLPLRYAYLLYAYMRYASLGYACQRHDYSQNQLVGVQQVVLDY